MTKCHLLRPRLGQWTLSWRCSEASKTSKSSYKMRFCHLRLRMFSLKDRLRFLKIRKSFLKRSTTFNRARLRGKIKDFLVKSLAAFLCQEKSRPSPKLFIHFSKLLAATWTIFPNYKGLNQGLRVEVKGLTNSEIPARGRHNKIMFTNIKKWSPSNQWKIPGKYSKTKPK